MTDELNLVQTGNSLATELSARLGTMLETCPASTNTTLLAEMITQHSSTALRMPSETIVTSLQTPSSIPSYIMASFNNLMAASNGTLGQRLDWADPTTSLSAPHGLYCLSSTLPASTAPTLIYATQDGNLPCFAINLASTSSTSSTALTIWQAPTQSSNWMDSIPSLSNASEFLIGCWQGCAATLTHQYQSLPPASSLLPTRETMTASLPSKETLLTLLATAAPTQETIIPASVITGATLIATITAYRCARSLQNTLREEAEERRAVTFAKAHPTTEEGKAYYTDHPRRSARLG